MKTFLTKSIFAFLIYFSILTCEKNPASFICPIPAKIAYISWDSYYQLYLIDENGENVKKFTDLDESGIELAWCPDGRGIAYLTTHDYYLSPPNSLYFLNNDLELKRIFRSDEERISDISFSPDGSKIVCALKSDRSRIAVVNRDGSAFFYLTPASIDCSQPRWSPDGIRIAFIARYDNMVHLSTIATDRSNFRYISSSATNYSNPQWSPTGEKIAFVSYGIGGPHIYLVNPDGSNFHRLCDGSSPAWSPGGSRIAYVFYDRGARKNQLHIIDIYGGDITRIPTEVSVSSPQWFRDGRRVAFIGYPPSGSRKIYSVSLSNAYVCTVTDTVALRYEGNFSIAPYSFIF